MLNPNSANSNPPIRKIIKLKVKCNRKMNQVGFEPSPFSLQDNTVSAKPAYHSELATHYAVHYLNIDTMDCKYIYYKYIFTEDK